MTGPHVLRDYALLADGERGALVGPSGDISWLCFPRWDSGSVFATLVGGTSSYRVVPTGRHVWGGYYEPGSLIWRNRWVTEHGIVECRDALRYPAESDRVVLLRRITAIGGPASMLVELRPRAGYDRHPLTELHHRHGTWTGRLGELHLRWHSGPGARTRENGELLQLQLDLRARRVPRSGAGARHQPSRTMSCRRRASCGGRPRRPGSGRCPRWRIALRRRTPGTPMRCCVA